jgi:P-type Na+/K+ transporter
MDKKNFSLDQPAYRLQPDKIAQLLNTNVERGLSKQEAKRRHEIVGDNALEGEEGVSIWKVLVRQVANALTLVNSSLFHTDSRCW